MATPGVPPFELMALSFGAGFAASLALLAARGGRAALARLRQPAAPWLLAFAGLFLYHALYFAALKAAPPAEASLVNYLWPMLIVLFSALLPDGRLRARHVAGAALGLAGTALVLRRGGNQAGGTPVLGYAAALGAAITWAGYSVLNRRFAGVPSEMILGVCGAVALAGLACHLALEPTVLPAGAVGWAAVALLGVGPVGLAFLAWDFATKHGDLPVLGALSYLAPLLSTALLVAAGEAEASARLVAAAALVVGGALVATYQPSRAISRAK